MFDWLQTRPPVDQVFYMPMLSILNMEIQPEPRKAATNTPSCNTVPSNNQG